MAKVTPRCHCCENTAQLPMSFCFNPTTWGNIMILLNVSTLWHIKVAELTEMHIGKSFSEPWVHMKSSKVRINTSQNLDLCRRLTIASLHHCSTKLWGRVATLTSSKLNVSVSDNNRYRCHYRRLRWNPRLLWNSLTCSLHILLKVSRCVLKNS
jgi:hypothetical protein